MEYADSHIIDAINKAASGPPEHRLWSIYIGVFTEPDILNIEAIRSKFKCKVRIFDARNLNLWGN